MSSTCGGGVLKKRPTALNPRPGPEVSDGRATDGALLRVNDLSVGFDTPKGKVQALDSVDLSVRRGTTTGIVGESGSGKTVLTRSVMRLLPTATTHTTGEVVFDGTDLMSLSEKEMREYRGDRIGLIMQDSMTSLNPVMRVGHQISETLRLHTAMSRREARDRAIQILREVHIPEAESRYSQYPHQLSGGMRQRVAIGIALSVQPDLLIADEPTTALDVTVQAQILELLAEERDSRQMTMLLVSHDLELMAGRADVVVVMYAGQIVEQAPAAVIFDSPRMPYTAALMAASPSMDAAPHTPVKALPGQPYNRMAATTGCRFAPRCDFATDKCRAEVPPLIEEGGGQRVYRTYRCWYPLSVSEGQPSASEKGAT